MTGKRNPGYEKLSDEQLIKIFQKEEVTAFNEIVFRYKDRLINFLFRYTGNIESAEDIAQDTFIKLYKNKSMYVEIAKFSTWFYTIAINETNTYIRKSKKGHTISVDSFDDSEKPLFELQSDDPTPLDKINTDDEANFVQQGISCLDEKHREIIILRDIQNLEYEEISKILNIPLGTVRSRINRARESLKINLQKILKQKGNTR